MANNKDFKVKNGIQPTVYNEGVGTVVSGFVGYYLTGASYDNISLSISANETDLTDGVMGDSGTKLYVIGSVNDTVYQYNLSTANDLSTATYANKSFSVASQTNDGRDIQFKTDGTKMYILDRVSSGTIYQYSLSTAWDVSTASYDNVAVSFGADSVTDCFVFKPDGTKGFVCGTAFSSLVYQKEMTTAWDLSTLQSSTNFNINTQVADPTSIEFNNDGTKMFVFDQTSRAIYEYTLSTAYDVTTASYNNVSLSTTEDTLPKGGMISSDGSKIYMVGNQNDTIYQYSTVLNTASLDLSTGAVFDYTPTSDVQVTVSNPAASGTVSAATLLLTGAGTAGFDVSNASYDSVSLSIAGQETQGQGLSFKPDGTKMYVIGTNGDDVSEYNLSTAWDVSTASYIQSFSVVAQETNPSDLTFKPDGTIMYTTGTISDAVQEYALSTAWDVSTASHTRTFSVATQETAPSGIFFKSDGTKMYITGYAGDDVNEYNLSTAWNISTASFVQLFSVAAQEANPQSLSFSSDGTKMFVLGENGLDVNFYSLSTAWNISTASFSSAFALTAGEVAVRGLAFSNDGHKMYILDENDDTIRQYSSATPATITYDTDLEWAGGTAPTSPAIGETDVITISTRDGGTTYQAIQAIDGAK